MGNTVKSFHDLVAWQKAMELVTEIYQVSQKFPKEEIFGLTSQLRRAAVSIPSNIAEGRGKSSTGEFQQFLYHAGGSLAEVETQLLIATNLEYLGKQEVSHIKELIARVGRLLHGLLSAIKKHGPPEKAAVKVGHAHPTIATGSQAPAWEPTWKQSSALHLMA
jgi:four helix bundle protein